MIATAVCNEVDLSRTSIDGLISTCRSPLHLVARALIVDIGRHYGYTYQQIAPEAGYDSHSSAIDAKKRLDAGVLDGTVKSIKHKMTVLSAMIVADLDTAKAGGR